MNGNILSPAIEKTILPNSTATASSYDEDTFYTVQNLGSEAVFFSLSSTDNVGGSEVVLLNSGETRSRLAVNLAPSGTFLVVNNPNASAVKVKVCVE